MKNTNMKVLEKHDLDALHKLKEKLKANKVIGERAGLSEMHISRLLKAKAPCPVDAATYDGLYPLLKPIIDEYSMAPHPECLQLCQGLLEPDLAMIREYKQLKEIQRKAVRDYVEDQYMFRHTGTRVDPPTRNKKKLQTRSVSA